MWRSGSTNHSISISASTDAAAALGAHLDLGAGKLDVY